MNIIRIDEVMRLTGKGKSTIYADMRKKLFPRPVHLDSRSTGWILQEVTAWIEKKIAERDHPLAAPDE